MFAIAIQPVEAKKDGYYKDQQKARVKDGIRDGSLTPREVEKLRKKQAQINAQRAQFRSTGDGLTEREREKFSGTSKATSASRSIEKNTTIMIVMISVRAKERARAKATQPGKADQALALVSIIPRPIKDSSFKTGWQAGA